MRIITVRAKIKDVFERKDEFMFPSSRARFVRMDHVRPDKRNRGFYTDVLHMTENGKYRVSKDGGTAKQTCLHGHTEVLIVYESETPDVRTFEKLETFEQLVARIAPSTNNNLAGRYT